MTSSATPPVSTSSMRTTWYSSEAPPHRPPDIGARAIDRDLLCSFASPMFLRAQAGSFATAPCAEANRRSGGLDAVSPWPSGALGGDRHRSALMGADAQLA